MRARRMRLNVAVAAAIALGSFGVAENRRFVSIDVDIELTRVDQGTLENLVMGWGRVVSRDGKTVRVRLNDPLDVADRLKSLRGRKNVKGVTAIAPLMPGENLLARPRTELNQVYQEYRESYIAWAKATGTALKVGEAGETKVPGTGFLQSYLQYRHDRSYPNEFIDMSGYEDVANRRTFEFDLQSRAQASRESKSLDLGFFGGKVEPKSSSAGGPEDITGQWEFTGPRDLRAPYRIYFGLSPVNGRANAVAFDPIDTNTYYAGGAQGGVWKTTDGGVNWSSTTDGWPLLGVSSLAVHPTNRDIVLAGTGDFFGNDVAGIGVMRSTDGGATWTRTGLNMTSARISAIKFFPENPSIVIAAAGKGGERGIFRSTDAGATWTEQVTTNSDWADLEIGALRGNGSRTIWACSGGNPGIIAFSDNQGVNWTTVTSPVSGSQNPLQIATSKTNPDRVYLMSTTARRIYRSDDKGTSWTDISAGFQNGSNNYNWSQGWYDYYLDATTRNTANGPVDVLFAGLIDIVMSIDGGATWRNIGGSNYTAAYSGTAIVHQDNHNIAIDPNNPLRALVATDGGVFRMLYNNTNDTVSWTNLNKNLGITQFYTLAVHPTNKDYIKGGTQDNSTPHSFGNLILWGNPGAGDGAGCAINPINPNIQYNSSQFHGLDRTTNSYSSSSGFAPNFGSDSVPFIGDLWLDPNDPTNVYVNTNYLWRYKEGTGAWTARLGGQLLSAGGQVRSMGFSTNSNIFYTGASDGDVYMTRNFGATWTRLDETVGFTNRSVLDISVSPSNTDDILLAVGGSGAHLYRITGTNTASPVLTNVSGSGSTGLPNVAASSIARDPWQPETKWYVATDVGVFMTSNAGATWEDITQSRGLPNVEVRRLVANKTTGYLTAATYGRGMWRIKIIPAQIQSVVANPTSVMSGDGGTVVVSLDRPAPEAITVPLLDNSANLNLPSSVTFAVGQSSVSVPYTTNEVTTSETVTISAELGGTATATVQVLATANFALTRFNLNNSSNAAGTLGSLANSDNTRLSWVIRRPASGSTTLFGRTRVATPNASRLRIEVEGFTTVAGLTYQILAFDNSAGFFRVIGSGVTGTSDGFYSADILNPTAYYSPTTELQIAFEVLPSGSSGNFSTAVDRVRVRALP